MYDGVPGLSSFSEMYYNLHPVMVQDPKPVFLHRTVEAALDQCFRLDALPQHTIDKQALGAISRSDFFSIFRRILSRHLKKHARTIEELALHRERNGGGREWLRGLMENLQLIAVNLYKYVRLLENSFAWENCSSPLCQDKRSFMAFQKDIIVFVASTSEIVAKTIIEAIKNREISHPFMAGQEERLQALPVLAQIELQIQENCEELHGKQKKKKKKKRGKEAAKEVVQAANEATRPQKVEKDQPQKVDKEEISQQQKELLTFLASMTIEQEQRARCPVSEEWIFSISPSSFFNQ